MELGTGNILMRHMQKWQEEDKDPAHAAKAKEEIAKILTSPRSPEGVLVERFVKGAAAHFDNDVANPLLFIHNVKKNMEEAKKALLTEERRALILKAAAGRTAAARKALGLHNEVLLDVEGTVHSAVEYACIRSAHRAPQSVSAAAAVPAPPPPRHRHPGCRPALWPGFVLLALPLIAFARLGTPCRVTQAPAGADHECRARRERGERSVPQDEDPAAQAEGAQ